MRKDLPLGAEQNSNRGAPGSEPQIPPVPTEAPNLVYNAELTKEEIVLLASLGLCNPTTGEISSAKIVAGTIGRMLHKIRAQHIEASNENKDSIELSRNAKGEYAYKIKVYIDAWRKPEVGIMLVDNINKAMLTRYAQKPEVREK